MPEQTPNVPKNSIRPTKKQRDLLTFIEEFIAQHGYSPSYREIMVGMSYNSVATVALHVNNLIKRGHLIKREHSARSLEVVKSQLEEAKLITKQLKVSEEKWLIEKIELYFAEVEAMTRVDEKNLDSLYVLVGSLRVLGLEGAAQSFLNRLANLKKKLTIAANSEYVT